MAWMSSDRLTPECIIKAHAALRCGHQAVRMSCSLADLSSLAIARCEKECGDA
jgi:hypothetical protein